MSGPNYPIIVDMRYLILILAFPLLVQAQPDSKECVRLRTVASELEKMIQGKFAGATCDELPASEFENFDYRCKDLSAIELQLKSLENEIAMINGVKNLRDEVLSAKATLEKHPNKGIAQDASQQLYQNLKIAVQIEGYLNATGIKGENLLTALAKASGEDFQDASKFAALVAATCIKIGVAPGSSPICENPQISDELLAEVNGLLLLGRKTERKFSKSQVEDLKKAMAIKNGDKDYSFAEMLKAVADPGAAAFSEKDVATLTSLKVAPDSDEYAFLNNMKSASAKLSSSVDLTQAQNVAARFKSFITDLKNREEWELKSKISVVLNELKDDIPASAKDACAGARELNANNFEDCFKPISTKINLPGYKKNSASNILHELKIGQNHIKKLDEVLAQCVPDDQMNLPDNCNAYTDAALLTLTKKATELNVIKAKILEESSGLLLTRDLAIETLYNKQCLSSTQSDINGCAAELGAISREAVALSDAAGVIVFMYNKPKAVTDVDKICKDIPQGTSHSAEVCKLARAKAPEAPVMKKNQDLYSQSITSERNSSQEALSGMIGALAQTAGAYFMPNQQMVNPYANMYPYTPNIAQPRDIKNQIMDPYMVSGFGSYAPTPGLRPYSSINSNVGTASAYSFGASSYFNSPVGW